MNYVLLWYVVVFAAKGHLSINLISFLFYKSTAFEVKRNLYHFYDAKRPYYVVKLKHINLML